ncbi:MAG: hypothetical protein KDI13_02825 [Alphaproteobacteria bacterium]|nr:hypothetical protein [Alphaproteobacteria bacterium]
MHGKPVVSADLNNSSAHASPKIIIPLTINLADRYGLILPAGAEMKPEVARIEFDPDGRIIYNGQDITNKVQTICATQTEHGQPPSDSVASTPETTDDGKDVIKGRYPEDMPTYNN